MLNRYVALAALLLLPSLSGCIAVAAGAGAGGATGYYMSKDEDRHSDQVQSDTEINNRVKDRLASDTDIAPLHLSADTYDNVVTLRGETNSPALAERAIQIARSTAGVKGVRSEITVH